MSTVTVKFNNIDSALKHLKKLMQREGTFGKMREKKEYDKPSEAKRKKRKEAARRSKKARRHGGSY